MARRIKNTNLESRDARSRLPARGKPYWQRIEPGLFIGYRRLKKGSGRWVIRHYVGAERYITSSLAVADDFSDPDFSEAAFGQCDLTKIEGTTILTFWQAQSVARARRSARQVGSIAGSGPYTVAECMADYLKELAEKRKPTKESDRRFKVFIEPTLGDVEVNLLTTEQIEQWHRTIAKTPPRIRTKTGDKQQHRTIDQSEDAIRARQASANRILTILKAALNQAWRKKRKLVPSDDAWRSVEPFRDVGKSRAQYLSVKEAARLVDACDPEFRNLVQGALQTGARYGQLASLRVSDFNQTVGNVRLSSRKGKGSKERIYYASLTAEGINFFRSLCANRDDAELVFPNEGRIDRAIDRDVQRFEKLHLAKITKAERANIEKRVRKQDNGMWRHAEQIRPMLDACRRAKITPAISFHILRHTWASLAVMGGVPLLVVARNLGHTDTRMVEAHYGHLAPSFVTDAIRANAPRYGLKPDKGAVNLR